jgi:hypothetical protein
MFDKFDFQLLDGSFTAEEARTILFALINSKINFHELEALSIREYHKGDSSHAEKRVAQLKAMAKDLSRYLDYAQKNKFKLQLKSDVIVKLEG